MKRWLAVVLTLILLTGTSALALDPLPFQGSFPIVEEPITLTCFNWAFTYTRGEFKDQLFWKELEALTGIHIEFETYFSDVDEKLALKLATLDLPDFFYKINQSSINVFKYASDEVFAPISPYLAEHAPHFSYQLQNLPALEATVTMPDGNIYGFPYLVTAAPATTVPMFVNQGWLEQLGYEAMPNTLEDLKALLMAVRDADLNDNGDPSDEIPLISNSVNHVVNMFLGSFGLATRGTTAPKIDMDPDGKLRFYPVQEEFRDLLRYVRDLYANKLIYQEIFDVTTPIVTALGEQDLLFMGIFNIRDYVGETHKNDFGGIYEPFAGPTGEQFYSIRTNPISLQNTFISTTNPYPAETVAMVDYFYSDEGVRMYFMGFEDITYSQDAEGRVVYSDLVTNNPDGLGKEEVLGMYVPWAGGRNPSMAEDRYFGYNMYPPLEQSITASLHLPERIAGQVHHRQSEPGHGLGRLCGHASADRSDGADGNLSARPGRL